MSARAIDLDLTVEAGGWDGLGDVEALCRRAAAAALEAAQDGGEHALAVLLTNDAAMREINCEWRDQDKPTNVLSFPAAPVPGLPGPAPLGDLVLAFETVAREAGEEGKSVADHVAHLVAHGVLHCLGYDHEDEAEAQVMEAIERRAMALLGIPDPYGTDPQREDATS